MFKNPVWAEIKNDYTDNEPTLAGDAVAITSIDAWETGKDDEEGCGIATVILTKSGDIAVAYRDYRALHDENAQAAIREAAEALRESHESKEDPGDENAAQASSEPQHEAKIEVETPHGVLEATESAYGAEFPGITIFLTDKKGNRRQIAVIEYTADEVSCGYNPHNPETMIRENSEVPESRRGEVLWYGNGATQGYKVTPGLICRAWPDLYDEDADHRRVVYDYNNQPEGGNSDEQN